MLRLIIMLCLLLPSLAQAGVIETNEWENLTRAGWSYGGGFSTGGPVDCSAGSPAGGCALKFTFYAGSYTTSITGGITGYYFPLPSEIYFGHWIKWSSNWHWNPVGSKIDYFTSNNADFNSNMMVFIGGNGSTSPGCFDSWISDVQRIWGDANGPGTYRLPNGFYSVCPGQWYWLEYHFKFNTPGQSNGIFEVWVNNTLVKSVSTVALIGPGQQAVWQGPQHSPEFGGGGSNIPSDQYIWIDHTVISTTRIGMPGTPSGGDTTPPAAPLGLRVQ